jgi:hypothetical protein
MSVDFDNVGSPELDSPESTKSSVHRRDSDLRGRPVIACRGSGILAVASCLLVARAGVFAVSTFGIKWP